MAKKQEYKYRIAYYVGIIVTVASLVLAIYHISLNGVASYFATYQQQQTASYVLFGIAGVWFIAQLLLATIASAKRHSAIGFDQWLVSLAVIVVTIVIVALLPLIFVTWIVELICDGISSKRNKAQ